MCASKSLLKVIFLLQLLNPYFCRFSSMLCMIAVPQEIKVLISKKCLLQWWQRIYMISPYYVVSKWQIIPLILNWDISNPYCWVCAMLLEEISKLQKNCILKFLLRFFAQKDNESTFFLNTIQEIQLRKIPRLIAIYLT